MITKTNFPSRRKSSLQISSKDKKSGIKIQLNSSEQESLEDEYLTCQMDKVVKIKQ